jgi:NodT family efflux transporter outer membrane factor (OMF) lipoprotein
VAPDWIDASDKRLRRGNDDLSKWWTVVQDPLLDHLICTAYKQNLTLREAGFRVLEARAQLGIAVGNFFPQTQSAMGGHTRQAFSLETANRTVNPSSPNTGPRFFGQWDLGFTMAWELDFWGRFRRGIEAASASLNASVEDYDDVLVTLLSDVATAYVQIRTLQKRIDYAQQNVGIQRETYDIAANRAKGGLQPGLNAQQALSILKQTEGGIPELKIALRQSMNQLCILLGIPPEELQTKLGTGEIPEAPPDVVIGIPADLLRRRPDVRRAERQAAAQCAQIGVAESAFYPHISMRGTIDYQAALFKNLFTAKALSGSLGPAFTWDILNYGRILNNVRFQDAKFQELVAVYQQSVLNANKEVEDGLVTFLRAHERAQLQESGVKAGTAALDSVRQQWKIGTITDYTRVAQLAQNQVQLMDVLAQAQGEIALGLIQVYKALGGGWQIRCTGCEPTALATLGAPSTSPDGPATQLPGRVPPPAELPLRNKGRQEDP